MSLYFTDEEIEIGNKILNKYTNNNEFGCLLFGSRKYEIPWEYNWEKPLIDIVEQNKDITWFYYCQIPLEKTRFNFVKNKVNFAEILKDYNLRDSVRIQLYIKNQAKLNVGYQSGINDSVGSKNTENYCIPYPKQFLNSNIGRGITYFINGSEFKI